MVSGGPKRSVRVAERIREELSMVIRNLRDPRVAGTIVSRVEVTDDLALARIFVRHDMGSADDGLRKAMLRGLGAASGLLRRELGRSLGLRQVPDLRFAYDEAPDAVNRIDEILREIHEEDRAKR